MIYQQNKEYREEQRSLYLIGKKKCRKCEEIKDLSDFYVKNRKSKYSIVHHSSTCKSCTKEIRKPKNFIYSLHSKYKITEDIFQNILSSQENKCQICKNPFSDINKIQVDHDHDTGKVRGLLCIKCNTGIGKLNEDIKILESAIEYLKIHQI
jgi:hypothetical protein